MKTNLLLGSCVLLAGVLSAAADSKDTVIGAAHKLADSSYAYVATPKYAGAGGGGGKGFQPGPVEGQVEKGGLARTSQSIGQNKVETFFKGDKAARKTADGWKTAEELLVSAKQGGGGGGKGKGGGFAALLGLRNYKTPAEQAADAAEKAKELKESDGAIVGELSESAAKELMPFGGRGGKGPEVTGAKGSVKFWIKDGALSKFEYHVEGTMSANGNDRPIDLTNTIEIKDVGSVKISIPDDVKSKLD